MMPGRGLPNAGSRFNKLCNARQTIADIAEQVGIALSQAEVDQLAQAITAGGQAGMAVALTIASTIAGANYSLTPAVVSTLTNTLNQGSNRNLLFSQILWPKLALARARR